jgi:hypothetical protein
MLFQDLPPISPPVPPKREPHPRPWRKGSVFGDFRRPIDRNDRARIIAAAEALERRTKLPGKRNGAIGQSGLAILRALLFHFLDPKSGQLDPSYKQMRAQTRFCVQTISQALKRLAACGILEIHRRITRRWIFMQNSFTGLFERRNHVEQCTNAYMVNTPLCERNSFGDLGTPLFRPRERPASDSAFQRESTPRFFHRRSAAERRDAWRAS